MTMQQHIEDCDAVIFDFDSTLVTIEGIDELARMNGVYKEVVSLTKLAMEGDIAFEQVFEKRLNLIQPNRKDIVKLGELYTQQVTEHADTLIDHLLRAKKEVYVVSGGYSEALYPVTDYLRIPRDHVYANTLHFDHHGNYVTFDRVNPLWQEKGKVIVLSTLQNADAKRWVAIGDGMTDAKLSEHVDAFICFTGVVEREHAVQYSTFVCSQFTELFERKFDD